MQILSSSEMIAHIEVEWEAFSKATRLGDQTFIRGVNDCCAWAVRWAEQLQGYSFDSPYIGKPLTDAEALAIIEEWGDLGELANHTFTSGPWREALALDNLTNGTICLLPSYGNPGRVITQTLGLYSNGFVLTIIENETKRISLRAMPAKNILRAWTWTGEVGKPDDAQCHPDCDVCQRS